MKRLLFLLMLLSLMMPHTVLCAGDTVTAFTPFADVDFAAQAYIDIVDHWEQQTGNTLDDWSGLQDSAWMDVLASSVEKGDADVVIVPSGVALDSSNYLTVSELSELLPGISFGAVSPEGSGESIKIPMRYYFETLYVNTDTLANYATTIPVSYSDFIVSCAQIAALGGLPVANAIAEWPEIVLDCAALMGSAAESYGSEASLATTETILRDLYLVGAFGPDAFNISDTQAEEAFLSGEAAMRFDTVDFASMIPEERAEHVMAIPLPGMETNHALVGFPTYGLAVCRSVLENAEHRDAVLSFVSELLNHRSALLTPATGGLADSIANLASAAEVTTGILYDRNVEGFDDWAEKVISHLMENQ